MYLKTMLSLGVTVVAIAGYLTASGFSQGPAAPATAPVLVKPASDLANGPRAVKVSSPNRIFVTTNIGVVSVDPDGRDEAKTRRS